MRYLIGLALLLAACSDTGGLLIVLDAGPPPACASWSCDGGTCTTHYVAPGEPCGDAGTCGMDGVCEAP